jgi:hypothetical protein
MKLHSEAKEDVGMRSALAITNLGNLSKTFPKPPRERETGGRG